VRTRLALLLLLGGCAEDLALDGEIFVCATAADCAEGFVCDERERICEAAPACGDGAVDPDEACDDGPDALPGCVECEVPRGTRCAGAPSQCTADAPWGIAVGLAHRCWIEADRSLACTGSDLGLGGLHPTGQATVPPGLGPVKEVVAGDFHTCVVRAEDDTVRCFGSNLSFAEDEAGAILTSTVGQATVPPDLGPVRSLAAMHATTCAVDAQGRTRCWGLLTRAPGRADAHVEVSCGSYHACARDEAGLVECWGDSADGRTTPPAARFASLGLGRFHSCGVDTEGRVHCWGRDRADIGRTVAPEGRFEQVIGGHYFSCARDAIGAVTCWGTPTPDSGVPVVRPPPRRFVTLEGGVHGACGVTTDGERVCFGETP